MSEYPDHLNPFKESETKKLGRSLSRSFRGFKGFIRQSFRKKKSKNSTNGSIPDIEIRKTQEFSYNTIRNNVMSMPSPPTYNTTTSPPLPRSRFKERLSRSSLSTYDERCNPFAEEGVNPFDEPPVPYRRRKSKKNAPLPPSSSNPDVYLGYKIKGSSKWSLTSSETDYTIDDKSEYSGDVTYYTQSLKECLDNFNKEMDTLNKESLEIGGSSPNILECNRNGQISVGEIENIINSKRTNSAHEDEIREINNNETEVLNSTVAIPENLETKTPVIIVTEEYLENSEDNPDIDVREEKQSQLHMKELEPEIQSYNGKTNRENKELAQVEYNEGESNILQNGNIELNENEKESIIYSESTITEPEEGMENISNEHSVEANVNHNQVNGNHQAHKQQEYEVVIDENLREKEMMEKLSIHDVNLEYIDDDESSLHNSEEIDAEKSQTRGTLAVVTTDSKDPSPTRKQRKYKLDKLILLGENFSPE